MLILDQNYSLTVMINYCSYYKLYYQIKFYLKIYHFNEVFNIMIELICIQGAGYDHIKVTCINRSKLI